MRRSIVLLYIWSQQQSHTEAASAILETRNDITLRHAVKSDQECTSSSFHDKVTSESLFLKSILIRNTWRRFILNLPRLETNL